MSLLVRPFIGAEMAQMPPWSAIGSPPESIVSNLKTEKPGLRRFEAMLRGDLAGLIAIHHPWLHGPYLQLLAIRRPFQRMGLGLDLLKWMEAEARREQARQLWLCVSSFNANARVFYERFGFEETALIEKLASDLSDEVLMRKRLYYE